MNHAPDLTDEAKAKAWVVNLIKQIWELAGMDPEATVIDYPVPDHAVWFPWGADAKPVYILLGHPLALNEDFSVFTFFAGEEDLRVYVTLNKTDPKAKPTFPFRLYRLSLRAAVYSCQSMPLDVFKQMIADEWSQLVNGKTSAEAAYAAMADYIGSLPENYSMRRLKEDIERGDLEIPEPTAEPEAGSVQAATVVVAAPVAPPSPAAPPAPAAPPIETNAGSA